MSDIRQSSLEDLAACIGLDWADQRHVICLQAMESQKRETAVVEQTPESLQDWIVQLRQRFGGRPVAIALEQSRGGLLHALMGIDFLRLYPVNPQTLAKFRQAFVPSGSKDDPGDADLLLELLVKHRDRLRVWLPDDPQTRRLQLLVEGRRTLVDQRTAFTNQLMALLKGYFPQALDWAGDLERPLACDFLERWPRLEALQATKPSAIRKFYRDRGCRNADKIAQRVSAMRQARPLTSDPAVVLSSILMVHALTPQIRSLTASIAQFDKHIAELFDQHPDNSIFQSFPGAGSILAPRLLAGFGSDRSRFEFASEMQQLSGIAPVTERSGKTCWVHWRLACSKFLRQTFQEFAAHSIRYCRWAGAYYHQMMARGLMHHAAVRALAYKWIRILFRCWKDRVPYDDNRYTGALARRGSPLALALAAATASVQSPSKSDLT